MNKATRMMALDVGDKRIGIAISDELGISAQPLSTLERRSGFKADLNEIARIVEEYKVSKVVIGVPINMDGSEGEQSAKALEFAERLRRRIRISVDTWDERLTTAQAERSLIALDKSRAKRKEVVDQLAAALILENYMAAKGSGTA